MSVVLVENFDAALSKYILEIKNASLQIKYRSNSFRIMEGKKYVRVVEVRGSQDSAHSFVEKLTGNIYKPESWKSPMKKIVRGNIYSEQNGAEALDKTTGGIWYAK